MSLPFSKGLLWSGIPSPWTHFTSPVWKQVASVWVHLSFTVVEKFGALHFIVWFMKTTGKCDVRKARKYLNMIKVKYNPDNSASSLCHLTLLNQPNVPDTMTARVRRVMFTQIHWSKALDEEYFSQLSARNERAGRRDACDYFASRFTTCTQNAR